MLDTDTLQVLYQAITNQIWQDLTLANRMDDLEHYFIKLEMEDIYQEFSDQQLEEEDYGKIAIIGALNLPEQKVVAEFEKIGHGSDDLEFYVDYSKLSNTDFEKFLSDKYEKILVGAMPHSVKGKGQASSGIRMLENIRGNDVIRLQGSNGKLKITLNTIKQALDWL